MDPQSYRTGSDEKVTPDRADVSRHVRGEQFSAMLDGGNDRCSLLTLTEVYARIRIGPKVEARLVRGPRSVCGIRQKLLDPALQNV
ncbi:MAG: hypothetical protein AAF236_02765 [Verrucomicrobiota bacterium]